jgi:hypothetical protein
MILLVQGSFINSQDAFIIVNMAGGTIAVFFFKYSKKMKVIRILTVLWIVMCLATVFSCTVFNNISIVKRSITHITSITYKYSDVKEVHLYYSKEFTGKTSKLIMHYEFKMKDGNNINLVSNKSGNDFRKNFSKYVQLEGKITNVPHFTNKDFIDEYEDLFPVDYFESFTIE